jgi:hypothetical protein
MWQSFGEVDGGTSILWLFVAAAVVGGVVWLWKGPTAGVATAVFLAPPPGPWPI